MTQSIPAKIYPNKNPSDVLITGKTEQELKTMSVDLEKKKTFNIIPILIIAAVAVGAFFFLRNKGKVAANTTL